MINEIMKHLNEKKEKRKNKKKVYNPKSLKESLLLACIKLYQRNFSEILVIFFFS